METLLLLIYAALSVAIFKIFKIPLTKWTVPTAVLGGIIFIVTIILLMNYNHPYTKVARTVVVTTPIVPLVKGRVVEVPVQPNVPLKKGDVLFRIDPTAFQATVDEKRALVAKAKQNVKIAKENWNQTKGQVERAQAQRDRAKTNYERYAKANKLAGRNSGPFSEAKVDNLRETYLAAKATLVSAAAAKRSAKLLFESNIDGVNTDVAQYQAELEQAKFNLDQTTVYAPTDGMVTQLILRPGFIAVPLPLKPVMVFVHAEKPRLFAAFLQNYVYRLKLGDEAEVLFRALPGRIFKGKIASILPVLAQGALQPSGTLISANRATYERVPVHIVLEEDTTKLNLPIGAAAEVAIYTEHVPDVAIIRKVLFRVKSWENYVFGEGYQ